MGRADSRTLNSDTELCDLQQVIGFLWTPVPRSVACGTWITVDAVCTPPPRSPLSSVLPDSSCSACWLRTVPSCPLSGDPLSLKEATSSAGGGRGRGQVANYRLIQGTEVQPWTQAGTSSRFPCGIRQKLDIGGGYTLASLHPLTILFLNPFLLR